MRYILIPLVLYAGIARAEEPPAQCDDTAKIHAYLGERYGELPFADLRDGKGRQLLLYVSPKTSTWTVLAVDGDRACGIAAGEDFKPAEKRFPESSKPKSPS